MKAALLAFLAIALPQPVVAQGAGVVTAADPRATEAGREMLRAGGSAADAAMAMMLALTVVEPQSSGIGGGGFLVYQDAKTGVLGTIDGREKAPAAATPERFLGPDGQPRPFPQLFPGGRSVGVPGNIRLMATAERKWGRLPWKALFAPAIRLAEQGYAVTPPLANSTATMQPMWKDFPAVARQYTADGRPLAVGATVRNPALARTLRRVADEGPDAFYTGDNARALLAAVTETGVAPSDMTAADLLSYQARERPPICGAYRGYRICGMGPPSSGGITVLQVLGMLERFDMKRPGKDSAQAWHLIAEAMQLAYADRDTYIADRDFVEVPVAGLIDPAYIRARSRLIATDRALNSYAPGKPAGAAERSHAVSGEVPSTTHFIAVDRDGSVATMTSTVEGPFGSQLLAGGYVLNNELTDFTAAPTRDGRPVANRVEGGKRPLSSMAPTIVYDAKGQAVFTVGAAGGRTIIMQVAKAIIAHIDWGLGARDAIGEPLLFFNRDGLIAEQGTKLEAMVPGLAKIGHRITVGRLGLKANAAERTTTGWVGAADPRSVGNALSE